MGAMKDINMHETTLNIIKCCMPNQSVQTASKNNCNFRFL